MKRLFKPRFFKIIQGANEGQTLKIQTIFYFTYLGWLETEIVKTLH
jgi:hypothetical protein